MNTADRKQFKYFDHIIESDVPLPELPPCSKQNVTPDVSFDISSDLSGFSGVKEWSHHWRATDQSITLSFARDKSTLYLHFPGMARFAIRDNGCYVTCYARPTLTIATIRHLLVDQVLPRLFAHFYSSTVLHASFLSVKGRGIAFLGDSGWGKSTIAAGLGVAGNTILNDDCLAVSMHGPQAKGIPAYYGLRLLRDSLENVGDLFRKTEGLVAEYTEKQRINTQVEVSSSPKYLPLQAIFLLTSPTEGKGCTGPEVSSVGGAFAMMSLLKNSFCLDVQDQRWQVEHFNRISRLVKTGLPIYFLRYPREYKKLPEVEKAVMHTLDQL